MIPTRVARKRRVFLSSVVADPGDASDGIYGYEQDPANGALLPTGVHVWVPGASFVNRDPSGTRLYVAEALLEGKAAAFAVGVDGELKALGSVPTGGAGPCHVAVMPSGAYLLSAHYGSGHLSVHRLSGDGSIAGRCDLVCPEGSGPNPERQEHSHGHFVWPEPSGRFALLVDLGADAIRTYEVDQGSGRLREAAVGPAKAGSGPRHLRAHPDGYLLVTGELDSSLMTFALDPITGAATWRSSVPASRQAGPGDNAPSELTFSPDGRFCYVANRGPDTLGVFSLAGTTPELIDEVSCQGHHPRHMAVVGEHLYVANQDSGAVVSFALDPERGTPRPTSSVLLPRPFCVRALPLLPSALTSPGPPALDVEGDRP